MVGRISGWAIIVFWCAATGWLVWHDVWPAWSAGEPPSLRDDGVPSGHRLQTGIFKPASAAGGAAIRRGTIWTSYEVTGNVISRSETMHLSNCPPLPPLRIEVDLQFDAEDVLDEFKLYVHGADVPIELTGERFASQTAFKLEAGPVRQTFKIPSAETGMLSGNLNPFPAMSDLYVGRTWRMQVFDPLSVLSGRAGRFRQVLATVTGTERLATQDGSAECFVVKAEQAMAWVAPDGRVLKQRVELPLIGTLELRDEPYDELARTASRRAVPNTVAGGRGR